jgi:hypothetical protein
MTARAYIRWAGSCTFWTHSSLNNRLFIKKELRIAREYVAMVATYSVPYSPYIKAVLSFLQRLERKNIG